MRILYGIQGTGHGHKSRAEAIIPILKKYVEVDILVSGLPLDQPFRSNLDIDIRYLGYGFVFGKEGGIDIKQTLRTFSFRKLIKAIRTLDLSPYDLIISDFEPITAWAAIITGKESISLSHQGALLDIQCPGQQHLNFWKRQFLRLYAPVTKAISFHFNAYSDNVHLPIIRPKIRALRPFADGHYLVYLPAYSIEHILNITQQFPDHDWIVFHKSANNKFREKNTLVLPTDQSRFLRYLESASGVICGAGFELPAEALFLKKKLMVVPMKGQFEQKMNAAALEDMGVSSLPAWDIKEFDSIEKWLRKSYIPEVNYYDTTNDVVQRIIGNIRPHVA